MIIFNIGLLQVHIACLWGVIAINDLDNHGFRSPQIFMWIATAGTFIAGVGHLIMGWK